MHRVEQRQFSCAGQPIQTIRTVCAMVSGNPVATDLTGRSQGESGLQCFGDCLRYKVFRLAIADHA